MKKWLSALLLMVALACGVDAQVIRGGMPDPSKPTRPPAVDYKGPAGSDIPNLDVVKKQIIAYHDSGKWDDDISKITDDARRHLEARRAAVSKPALVLDIDETALSNWHYFNDHDFAVLPGPITKWLSESRDTQIAGTGNLFRFAVSKQVAVFFITGRKESLRAATEKNLENAGYNGYTALHLEPEAYKDESVIGFKSSTRRDIQAKGYTILVNVGDQESDLAGGYAEKTYKLPNPMYFLP
ncbi:MAG: acid phosphatase [Armatimonadetes bacterium]|nr:acid phosphatase [Armatimonadota bacterium]